MFVLIDNYDSFTFNLVHYFHELGAEIAVHRNDALTAAQVLALRPQGLILSPGPGTPYDAGICLDLIAAAADDTLPLLGVCLGHQAIGQAFGGRVARAPRVMHGKVSKIRHDGTGVFKGLPQDFEATRYHSLVVEDLPADLAATARTADGLVMGLAHRRLPVHGVQFHPESVASQHGHALLRNFLDLAVGAVRRAA